MLDNLHTIQTSFERLLFRRIEKAQSILAVIKSSPNYSSKGEFDSASGLEKELMSYRQASSRYFDVLNQYVQIAMDRKNLLKGGKHSVKETAHAIMQSFSQNLEIDKTDRREISSYYSLIYAQNRLTAPCDFAKPTHYKEMSEYIKANNILLFNFKEMVEKVGKYESTILDPPYTIAHCHLLISEAETFDKKVNQLIEKSHSLYNGRIALFELIKQRCTCICQRSRFIFGADSLNYNQLKRLKLSII